ncbi:hypothetical protein [Streptomyces sp. NPDC057694]|uniref:hypothetical protein n=1 Tax=Streptomyces sp. NPDC057694 TaxID=3346216 RepID=UPI0036AC8EF7
MLESMIPELFDELTPRASSGELVIAKSVLEDVEMMARGEPIHYWMQGLSVSLSDSAYLQEKTWFMRVVQLKFGFEEGISDMEGRDPSLIDVIALARRCESEGREFTLISDDTTANPLRPSAADLCKEFGWGRLNMHSYIEQILQRSDILR